MLRPLIPCCLLVNLILSLAGLGLATPAHADPWDRGGHGDRGGGNGHSSYGYGYGHYGSGRSGDHYWSQGGHGAAAERWGGAYGSPYSGYGRAPYYAAPSFGREGYGASRYPQVVPVPSGRGNYLDRWRQGGPWSQAARAPSGGTWYERGDDDPRKPKPRPGPRGEGDGGDYR